MNYLEVWESSIDSANKLEWLQNDRTWKKMEATAVIVVGIVPKYIIICESII